ncbi:unnamed protein product [Cylindrotheca closterium]|uniref:Uncharacterized protein n=1 Tax=Cylindrotheca closterium TaxID=2856 RepID=A0AAD2G7P0_9STRA|nr:unnamed protein product [Cylindrotheca closterium]
MLRLLLALFIAQQIAALAPARSSTFRPAVTVNGARPPAAASAMRASVILRMSDGGDETKAKVSEDGTFYDDEMDSAPVKEGISESMRDRLIREASTGLDADQKQPNVILYVSIAVAILVALGGQGILY